MKQSEHGKSSKSWNTELQQQTQKAQQEQVQAQLQSQQQIAQNKQDFEAGEKEKDRILQLELKKMDLATKLTSDADGNGRKDEIDRARLDVEKQKVELQRQKGS